MVHLFPPFDAKHPNYHIPSLKAFLKPKPKRKDSSHSAMARGTLSFSTFYASPLTWITATTLAWRGTYKGDLADVLFKTIADYLSLERTPYARLTSIVNSSGTGKSRMVDQLGKEVITVPSEVDCK